MTSHSSDKRLSVVDVVAPTMATNPKKGLRDSLIPDTFLAAASCNLLLIEGGRQLKSALHLLKGFALLRRRGYRLLKDALHVLINLHLHRCHDLSLKNMHALVRECATKKMSELPSDEFTCEY